jgi:hypothetical protein
MWENYVTHPTILPSCHGLLPIIPKGYCVHSQEIYMGLIIVHLYTLQEIFWLKDMINHSFDHMDTGNLYNTSLEHLLLELGKGDDLSVIPFFTYSFLTMSSLVKSSWEFLHLHKLTLKHTIKIPTHRAHDAPIMVLIQGPNFFNKNSFL